MWKNFTRENSTKVKDQHAARETAAVECNPEMKAMKKKLDVFETDAWKIFHKHVIKMLFTGFQFLEWKFNYSNRTESIRNLDDVK